MTAISLRDEKISIKCGKSGDFLKSFVMRTVIKIKMQAMLAYYVLIMFNTFADNVYLTEIKLGFIYSNKMIMNEQLNKFTLL